ncbi:MAG: RpiB/LacA/LacB family sugar-phosphate isomerase [Christensenellales bacterium]
MIYISCDHAGFDLKQKLVKWFKKTGLNYVDFGAKTYNQLDSYVDYAKQALNEFIDKKNIEDKLVLICGSGVGMSIVANRNKNIRAVLAYNNKQVFQARQHNDANCLCIGARNTNFFKSKKFIKTFLTTEFLGGKHLDRINSI